MKRSRIIHILLLLFVLAGTAELLARFHHGLVYGVYFPIYGGTVFYDAVLIDLAKAANRRGRSSEGRPGKGVASRRARLTALASQAPSKPLLLSGASVAWGYVPKGAPQLERLLEGFLRRDCINLARPGRILDEECDALLAHSGPPPAAVVFLSGFNDAFGLSALRRRQGRHRRFTRALPFLGGSLFCQKVLRRLADATAPPFEGPSLSALEKKLAGVIRRFSPAPCLFFFQPHYTAGHRKDPEEGKVGRTYGRYLAKSFSARRAGLLELLRRIEGLEVVDLQHLAESASTPFFLDPCHLTGSGTLAVAKSMSHVIATRISVGPSPKGGKP